MGFAAEHISPEKRQAVQTIQTFFLRKRYATAYQFMKAEYGVDIIEQSKINFQRLLKELKGNGTLLTTAEQQLLHVWNTNIVPLFTLKHATKKVEFDVLQPIVNRQAEGQAVNNAHTWNKNADRSFSYFVLGIDDHPTPNFLKDDVEVIVVKLGQLTSEQKRDFYGLWIGGHIGEYLTSAKLDPIDFGGTRRNIFFDETTLTKTYVYQRKNGEEIRRAIHFRDEIFSADQNVDVLFDALFYQFILELRYIGGEFQQMVYENADDLNIITNAFHLLFPSWVYPEAKLPLKLSLKKPYIEIVKQPSNFTELKRRWFSAAKQGDIRELDNCICEGISINSLDELSQSALIFAAGIQLQDKRHATIEFLLSKGANITIREFFGDSVLTKIIKCNDEYMLTKFLAGISYPQLPSVKRFIGLESYRSNATCVLEAAVVDGQFEMAKILLDHGMVISPTSPIVPMLYQALIKRPDAMKNQISFFITKGASVNAINRDGKTALMLAAEAGDLDSVEFFSMQGAQLEQVNASGDTVYFRVCDKLAGGFEQFLAENQTKPNDSILLDLLELADERKIAALQQEWEVVRKQLKKIKLFLKSQNVKQERPPKTLVQQYKYTTFVCAGLVTTVLNGESHVLLVRKKNPYTNTPYGYFLAPGGYKDLKDTSIEAAVYREIFEETNLTITDQAIISPCFTYEQTTGTEKYFAMHFFHIQLQLFSLAPLMAKDDVADARWVKWSEIEQRCYDNTIGYFYNGIRINQSNAMLIERLLQRQVVDDAVISQTLAVELNNSESMLKQMFEAGNLTGLHELYAQGIDFSKTSVLLHACYFDNPAMLDLLLELNTDVNMAYNISDQQFTPLIMASIFGKLNLVKVLVEHGAMIDLMLNDSTALTCAISNRHQALVEYFIVEKQTSLGQAIGHIALKNAVMSGEVEALALLLSKGVDLWAKDYEIMSYIQSCLHMANSGISTPGGISGEDLKDKTQCVLDHLESQTLNESQQALVDEIKVLRATASFEEKSSPSCPVM